MRSFLLRSDADGGQAGGVCGALLEPGSAHAGRGQGAPHRAVRQRRRQVPRGQGHRRRRPVADAAAQVGHPEPGQGCQLLFRGSIIPGQHRNKTNIQIQKPSWLSNHLHPNHKFVTVRIM